MLKKTIFLLITLSWAFMGLELRAEMIETGIIPISIIGQVKFEPRFTKVPQQICESAPCQSSQLYWSMVIYSGNTRYFFNQKLSVNDVQGPESIELLGVHLRPGSIVKVEGQGVPSSQNFQVLTQVDRVTLVMDVD